MRGNMSYCVNCGVELSASATECPLCNTPVINPKDLGGGRAEPPFPREKGQVETVKRKDLGLLVSAVVLATAVPCGLLNLLVFNKTAWSLAVIGVCVILWVMLVPVVIYTKQSVYISILLDGLAIVVYLYMLAYMVHSDDWFLGLRCADCVTAHSAGGDIYLLRTEASQIIFDNSIICIYGAWHWLCGA